MRFASVLGVVCALALHGGVLLFGGLLFPRHTKEALALQEVDLLNDVDAAAEQEKPSEPKPEKTEEIETGAEQAPDAGEVIRNLEVASTDTAPALEAASLSAIEAALSGQAIGGGDFAESLSFASGGRIGGTGKPGALDDKAEGAFSLDEIDQKPRPIFQGAPIFPSEMRGKKVEGVVTVIFVVDSSGKVVDPRVEKSSHPAFEKPALDAVKQWKFEPGIKGGQRVGCKMRVPIRFQPS